MLNLCLLSESWLRLLSCWSWRLLADIEFECKFLEILLLDQDLGICEVSNLAANCQVLLSIRDCKVDVPDFLLVLCVEVLRGPLAESQEGEDLKELAEWGKYLQADRSRVRSLVAGWAPVLDWTGRGHVDYLSLVLVVKVGVFL